MRTSTFETRLVYGTNGSLMVATRPGGYHSPPHVHPCEQINYLSNGELWIFTDKRAFLLRKGDFLRIPPDAVHWSWNRTDDECTLIEVHSPGLQDDPVMRAAAVGLFDAGERTTTAGSPRKSSNTTRRPPRASSLTDECTDFCGSQRRLATLALANYRRDDSPSGGRPTTFERIA